MSNYIVGDIHGCFSELKAALEIVDFDKSKDNPEYTYYIGHTPTPEGTHSYKNLK